MTLAEIIAEIEEKYPAAQSLSSDSKVRKIDKLQKRIFRTDVKRTVITSIELLADVALYPITFSPAKIREIIIDGQKYENRQLEAEALGKFFYILDEGIGIYPKPTQDGEMLIYHYQEPDTLSSLTDTPDLDSDYHDLLVYGVCKEVAENFAKPEDATYFDMQYKALMNEFIEANQDTEPAQIQSEGRWW
ncbi:phage adaptor protein [Gorillibacterium sp. sgz5001074]|uniref:phage adaptor protein n=1 Tax=Gorillibacterium sp. sgz5001074 TaxID=3446695 RepID=UPI003F67A7BF